METNNNNEVNKSLQSVNSTDNKIEQTSITGKKKKKSSALAAAALGRSAVDHVKANSSVDTRGSNGLANTGSVTSYENED